MKDSTGKPLSTLEKLFVSEYQIDPNAMRAAKKAGYTEKTAQKNAPLWVHKDRNKCPANKRHVWDAVQAATVAKIERNNVDADYVLQDLIAKNEADLADLFNDEGSLKSLKDIPKEWRTGLISGFEVKQEYAYEDGERIPDGVLVKVRLADRIKVLQLLGEHIQVQAFKKQVGLDVSSYVDQMRKARKRRDDGKES